MRADYAGEKLQRVFGEIVATFYIGTISTVHSVCPCLKEKKMEVVQLRGVSGQ